MKREKNVSLQKLNLLDLINYFNGELKNTSKFFVIHNNIPKLCIATYFSKKYFSTFKQ